MKNDLLVAPVVDPKVMNDTYMRGVIVNGYIHPEELIFEERFNKDKDKVLLHKYDPFYVYHTRFWDNLRISEEDKEKGSPKSGDMIAINPDDNSDIWLIEKEYFENNFHRE